MQPLELSHGFSPASVRAISWHLLPDPAKEAVDVEAHWVRSPWGSGSWAWEPTEVGAPEVVAGKQEPTKVVAWPRKLTGMGSWGMLSWSSWRQRLMHGERACSGGPSLPFMCHLTVVLCFCGGPRLLLKTPLVVSVPHFSPFRLSLCSQHQSLGLSSKPRVPAPSPCTYQQTHVSGWKAQCDGMTVCVGLSLSCLPQPIFALSSEPLKLPFFPDWSPWWCGTFPGCENLSSFSASSQRCRSHPAFLIFFFLLSYLVTWRSCLSFQGFEVFS